MRTRKRERQRKGATQRGTNTTIALQINSRTRETSLPWCRIYNVGSSWQREMRFLVPQPFLGPVKSAGPTWPLPCHYHPLLLRLLFTITVTMTTTTAADRRRGCTHSIHVGVSLMCHYYQRACNHHHRRRHLLPTGLLLYLSSRLPRTEKERARARGRVRAVE